MNRTQLLKERMLALDIIKGICEDIKQRMNYREPALLNTAINVIEEAMDIVTPKKPFTDEGEWCCPLCGFALALIGNECELPKECPNCGQEIGIINENQGGNERMEAKVFNAVSPFQIGDVLIVGKKEKMITDIICQHKLKDGSTRFFYQINNSKEYYPIENLREGVI